MMMRKGIYIRRLLLFQITVNLYKEAPFLFRKTFEYTTVYARTKVTFIILIL